MRNELIVIPSLPAFTPLPAPSLTSSMLMAIVLQPRSLVCSLESTRTRPPRTKVDRRRNSSGCVLRRPFHLTCGRTPPLQSEPVRDASLRKCTNRSSQTPKAVERRPREAEELRRSRIGSADPWQQLASFANSTPMPCSSLALEGDELRGGSVIRQWRRRSWRG